MRSTLAALALAIAVAIGLAAPAATPVRAADVTAGSGPKVVIIVGATHGTTERYRDYGDAAYAEAIKYTLERGQGLQPERDLGQGQGRGRGRLDRHLLRPRQRLAEPVHRTTPTTRPRMASGSTPRPATATATPSTTASRTSPRWTWRPTRSSCSTTCATRRATPSPGDAAPSLSHRQAARRQLRGGLPARATPGRSWPTATAARPRRSARSSRPTRPSSSSGATPRTPTATPSRSPPSRTSGHDRVHGPGQPELGLLSLARRRSRP